MCVMHSLGGVSVAKQGGVRLLKIRREPPFDFASGKVCRLFFFSREGGWARQAGWPKQGRMTEGF